MSYTICYTSKVKEGLTEEDILKIFETTSANNNKANIKGILLHAFDNFFQVLEGSEKEITTLYEEKILKDERHEDVFEIINRETPLAIFSLYSSTFNIVKTTEQLEDVKKYCGIHKLTSSTSDKIHRLLQPFIL